MKIKLENVLPSEIEKRSFEIITEELGDRVFDPLQEPIIKRAIHTSADSNMRILCAFQSMRWKKHWMRCVKALVS